MSFVQPGRSLGAGTPNRVIPAAEQRRPLQFARHLSAIVGSNLQLQQQIACETRCGKKPG
jgi:hypothetical protein